MSISSVNNFISNLTLCVGDTIADSVTAPLDDSFIENLRYAREAIDYTSKALPFGACNLPNPKASPLGIVIMRVHTNFKIIKLACWDHARYDYFSDQTTLAAAYHRDPKEAAQLVNEKINEIITETAEQHQVGNCGEQAIVALQYLKSKKNLSELSNQTLLFADHTFLIVGKESKSPIVCDPWAKIAYPLSDYNYHIKKILELNNQTMPFNNNFQSTETYSPQSKEIRSQVRPSLNPESELLVQKQVKNYHSYINRMTMHASLEKKSQDASIAVGSLGTLTTLGTMVGKIKARAGCLIGASSLILSSGCFFAKDFFPKHAKMYEEKSFQVWHEK